MMTLAPASLAPERDGEVKGLRRRPRVLVIAEAVTLAHVGRATALIQSLDLAEFELFFACDRRYDDLLPELPACRLALESVPSRDFLQRLARGSPVFDTQTLARYVEDDLRVIAESSPDVIIGDMRLSLSVSARVAGVPYVAICNAYWSPYVRQKIVAPDLRAMRWLGPFLGQAAFDLARPLAFAYHALPLNRVRIRYGMPPLRWDVREIYTDADQVLYADFPGLFDLRALPRHHHVLGPLHWSPSIPLPDWWDQVPTDSPMIYVNLGSSGRQDLLPLVLESLASFPATIVAATAGGQTPTGVPQNAYIAPYLPGDQLARRAAIVVCNGGSPAVNQALAAGKPVVGICSNMDQLLNMQAVCQAGAGAMLRAARATPAEVRQAVQATLHEKYRRHARSLASSQGGSNIRALLPSLLREVALSR